MPGEPQEAPGRDVLVPDYHELAVMEKTAQGRDPIRADLARQIEASDLDAEIVPEGLAFEHPRTLPLR
jgi:hypothetical protein